MLATRRNHVIGIYSDIARSPAPFALRSWRFEAPRLNVAPSLEAIESFCNTVQPEPLFHQSARDRIMRDESHSHHYELFMLGLCVYAIAALAVRSFIHLDASTEQVLDGADVAVCALFFVDFCTSLVRAERRWRYLYTWGWIDLLSAVPVVAALRLGRAARVTRILRVLRGVRATRLITSALIQRRAQSVFFAALFVSLLLIVFASVAVLQFETDPASNIKDGADALWWSFVTITTVGYGDRFPVTHEGRVVAVILMTAGVVMFGTFSGLMASWFVGPRARHEESEIGELREEIRLLRQSLLSTPL